MRLREWHAAAPPAKMAPPGPIGCLLRRPRRPDWGGLRKRAREPTSPAPAGVRCEARPGARATTQSRLVRCRPTGKSSDFTGDLPVKHFRETLRGGPWGDGEAAPCRALFAMDAVALRTRLCGVDAGRGRHLPCVITVPVSQCECVRHIHALPSCFEERRYARQGSGLDGEAQKGGRDMLGRVKRFLAGAVPCTPSG